MRANGSDLANDFKILWALVSRACNDQVEGVGRGREEGSAIVGYMFNARVASCRATLTCLIAPSRPTSAIRSMSSSTSNAAQDTDSSNRTL
jgi:hypothetical protein